MPGAGSGPLAGPAKVTSAANGLPAPSRFASVWPVAVWLQLVVSVNVVAGRGSGITLTLIAVANALAAETI